ncbi:MAG: PilZ domain-containing protein [Treponema sp.]|nr:PilZ domain-containing protein [Treponema sp.]
MTKEIVQAMGLIAKQIYVKCMGDFCPCVMYSSSFQSAKILVNIKAGLIQKLQEANNVASLRLCFKSIENREPVVFFVSTRSVGYSPYSSSKDVVMVTLQFTQRPPDDFIEILGRILDTSVNFARRKDERILLSNDNQRKLKIMSKESALFVQKVPRHCILRDISFAGAKIIVLGVAKFLEDREVSLYIDFSEPRERFLLKGTFVRSEIVEGRTDLVAFAMVFNDPIPMGYKLRINDYFNQQTRFDNRADQMPAQVASNDGSGEPAKGE